MGWGVLTLGGGWAVCLGRAGELLWDPSEGPARAQWSCVPGPRPTGGCAPGGPAPRQVNHRRARRPGARIWRSGAGSVSVRGWRGATPHAPPNPVLQEPNTPVLLGVPQAVTSHGFPKSPLRVGCGALVPVSSPRPPSVSPKARAAGRGARRGWNREPARPVGGGARGAERGNPPGAPGGAAWATARRGRGGGRGSPGQRAPSRPAKVVAARVLRALGRAGKGRVPSPLTPPAPLPARAPTCFAGGQCVCGLWVTLRTESPT